MGKSSQTKIISDAIGTHGHPDQCQMSEIQTKIVALSMFLTK